MIKDWRECVSCTWRGHESQCEYMLTCPSCGEPTVPYIEDNDIEPELDFGENDE